MVATPRETQATDLGGLIMKVNHAGEHGAVNIYRGQLATARLMAPDLLEELAEFMAHEERHRSIFAEELRRRGRPRCRSYALCGLGGYVLGFVTGLLGKSAIAATTVAVESVVLRHLKGQIEILSGSDAAAVAAITAIVDEEQAHHDQSVLHLQAGRFWPKLLVPVVSVATEIVIWTGMRV